MSDPDDDAGKRTRVNIYDQLVESIAYAQSDSEIIGCLLRTLIERGYINIEGLKALEHHK